MLGELGQEGTEPKLVGFKGFGSGFWCLLETWAGWAGDGQAAGSPGACWHGAASWPLEPAGCLQGRKRSISLPSRSPLASCPRGSLSPGQSRLRWERQGGSGRRLSRPSSWDSCEQGSGFPAPVTPVHPSRCCSPPARITSASPWPSAGDRGWRRVGATLQLGAWQLFRGIRGKFAPGRWRRQWLWLFAGPSPHTRFVPGRELPTSPLCLAPQVSV